MLLAKMPRHDVPLGTYKRADGEVFTVTGTIWESPPDYDYWMAAYDARHASWGVVRMILTVPKRIAGTITLATALLSGTPFEQVKSELMKVTADGKDLIWCPSSDGWSLVG